MALTELTVINTKPYDKPVKFTDGNGMHHSRKATTYEGGKSYDTKAEACGHGVRTIACALIESGVWSRDAVERQMSHQERNSVRAAYIKRSIWKFGRTETYVAMVG